MNCTITPKANTNAAGGTVNGNHIELQTPSVVALHMGPEAVARFERVGDDLVLELQDGTRIIIDNFFVVADDARSDIVFVDDAGVTWWGQYGSSWTGFDIAEITETTVVPVALLGAIGTLAGAALIIGSGGSDSHPADTTPPEITVEAPALKNDATPTITGTTDAAPGSTVTLVVTGSDGATQTLTTTVQPDGSYTVDVPANLAEGDYTVTASVKDPAGNTGSADDTGVIDTVAPEISVDAPELSTDATPTITGSTDAAPGSTVTLVVTGSDHVSQTFTTTVGTDGSYTVDVPANLAEGDYTVTASVKDPAGNTGSADDTGVIDTVAPEISVDAPELSNDATPTITGSTDAAPGSTVTLVVTGSDHVSQTFTTTVGTDGSYSVDVPADLAEGGYTVTASVTDPAGNTGSADDTGVIDTVAPEISVDAPELSNDPTPTITGSTDAAPGSTVTLVVTGSDHVSQTFTTTVGTDGSYSVDVPADLAEGGYTVTASVTDPAGNTGSADDTGVIDTVAPEISVDAPALSNDPTPTITGSTDAAPGSTVTLVVTGSDHVSQTFTTTVGTDGSYSVDVPADLAEGGYSVEASVTDPAGNTGSADDTGVIDTVAPEISVDAPALSNDPTPTITGSTDAAPGSTVTLVVTGSDHVSQTFTTTVGTDGSYTVD
ncbi:Ig-like domain-containing protein, partial [Paenirhodobacter huangdaonensis]